MKDLSVLVIVATCLMVGGCESPEESAARHLASAQAFFDEGDLIKARLEARNAVQLQPKNAEARYVLALISEREQDAKGTLGNLQLAIDADPDYLDARLKLGSYYVVGRRQQEARKFADIALELRPDSAEVHLLNARVLVLEDQPEAALKEGELALSLDPANPQVIAFVALLQAREGGVDEAMDTIDQGLESVGAEDVEFLRKSRVSILAEVGERDKGRAALEALAADFPENLSYQMALAELYLGTGRQADGEALIRELIARDPDNAEWRLRLVEMLVSQGRTGDAEANLRQAIADRPGALDFQLALAGFLESRGRTEEAIAVYRQVSDIEPRSADGLAARNRIAALLVPDNVADAKAMIAGILADAPDNADALLLRAALRLADNETDAAIADLRLVLVRRPTSVRALLGMARAQVLNGNALLAEEAYRKVLAASPAHPEASRELAVLVGNRGDVEEAEALLRGALRVEPDDPNASSNLVKALLIRQDFTAAEAEARRLVGAGTSPGLAEYQLGVALEAQQDVDGAIAAYEASLEQAPEANEPLTNLVRLWIVNDRGSEAEDYLKKHLADYPGHVHASLLLGEVYSSLGRVPEAEAVYRDLTDERPTEAGAYIGLAGLYPPASDERLAAIEAGVAQNPASPQLGLALGSVYEKRGQFEQAIEAYEEALQAADNDIIANNLAALLLDFRSDPDSHRRALELASRFERRQDAHPLNLAVLGWAYYRSGQYAKAVRFLERAVAGAQDVPQLRYYLGMAYLKNGNSVGARQELELAVGAAEESGKRFQGLDDAREALAAL
jgi:tetratricopeptide (TPR) repeat protein